MSVPHTQHTLDKLELLLNSLGYKLRYEKGSFKTAACILESSRVVVVNKFSNLESKIGSLIELIQRINIEDSALDEKQKHFLYTLKQTSLEL